MIQMKMSNPIEEQRQIIDQLYHAVMSNAPEEFTEAACRFEYDHCDEDGSNSVGSQLTFFHQTEKEYAYLRNSNALKLVPDLHAKMKAHTGGDWDAFTLFINEDGSVTTKFEYPDQEPLKEAETEVLPDQDHSEPKNTQNEGLLQTSGKPVYIASRSRKSTVRLVLNVVIFSLLILLVSLPDIGDAENQISLFLNYAFFVFCSISLLINLAFLWFSRHPLKIFEDKVVLGSAFYTTLPMKHIRGHGIHRKKGNICLEVFNPEKNRQEQLPISWHIIKEPVEEVVQALDQVISNRFS